MGENCIRSELSKKHPLHPLIRFSSLHANHSRYDLYEGNDIVDMSMKGDIFQEENLVNALISVEFSIKTPNLMNMKINSTKI